MAFVLTQPGEAREQVPNSCVERHGAMFPERRGVRLALQHLLTDEPLPNFKTDSIRLPYVGPLFQAGLFSCSHALSGAGIRGV